jgi:16S rRNA (guanine527-N7)-methyltransferase
MPPAESAVSSTELRRRLGAIGFAVTAEQGAALAAFVELLLKWNKVYNLTGVRGADEVVDRHLVESFALRALLKGTFVADVGSGAGLPGLPLAIAEPQRHFTLIESRAKRVRFLRHVVAELGLTNTEVAHVRAEDLTVERPFDTVLARAVAPPAELLRICRHLTAAGSILLLLTATHLHDAFRGLAADFLVQPVAKSGPKLRSSIVLLERINAAQVAVPR